MSQTIVIDPVTRVEGHGKVTLHLNDDGNIDQARLHIVEFRGFEKFIQGRPYWELPLIVQRLCGICPVSHHLAAAKAIDQIQGVATLSSGALALRRLLHFGQVLQSHALHFFHLASPDLLFGFTCDQEQRNIVNLIKKHPDLALKGVKIRKFGQQVIEAISGKRIHGIAAIPGGMHAPLTREAVTALQADTNSIINYCMDAVALTQNLFFSNPSMHQDFGAIDSSFLSLCGKQGELELYDGDFRIIGANGSVIEDQFSPLQYEQLIEEQVKSWSYMKFPFLKSMGTENGWYRVGPLARINTCSFIPTPQAEQQRDIFFQQVPKPCQSLLAYHWARMIEALHCAESIRDLLADPLLLSNDLVRDGDKQHWGIGVIEAPRGTLIHHYKIDDNDMVIKANLIVSTTNNNEAMNRSITQVAKQHLSGKTITSEMLNMIEIAIRAYDPCLSCATHAIGQMPLTIELYDSNRSMIDQISRSSDGKVCREP